MSVSCSNWTECKDASKISIVGVTVEFDFADKTLNGVTVHDGANSFRVIKDNYSIKLLVPTPPKMVDKWKLHGELLGAPYEIMFDDKDDALQNQREFKDNMSVYLDVTKVQVPDVQSCAD